MTVLAAERLKPPHGVQRPKAAMPWVAPNYLPYRISGYKSCSIIRLHDRTHTRDINSISPKITAICIETGRCGLKFNELSRQQTEMLNLLLGDCASHIMPAG